MTLVFAVATIAARFVPFIGAYVQNKEIVLVQVLPETPTTTLTKTSRLTKTLVATATLQVIPTRTPTVIPTPTQFVPAGLNLVIPNPALSIDFLQWWEVSVQIYVEWEETRQPDCPKEKRVSNLTWMMGFPQYVIGLASYYSPGLMEYQCEYRGISCYDGKPYIGGASLMSPADIGRPFWIRAPGREWEGPFVSVDAAASHDFCRVVLQNREVVEVDWQTWQRWGRGASDGGLAGVEVWMGLLPPVFEEGTTPVSYRPVLYWFMKTKPAIVE